MSGDASILAGNAYTDVSLSNACTDFRAYVFDTGANVGKAVAPTAGGDIDIVTRHNNGAFFAAPGRPVRIETSVANGNIAAGDNLEIDNVGRALKKNTGLTIARALEASSATGTIIWAVFTSGR